MQSELYEKWLPCDFFVRGKSYIFLESLGYYKKIVHTIQFFSDILWIFRTTIWWHQILQLVKNQKCDILYINQKIIQYWSFFTKRLGCLLLCFWVRRSRMKNDDVITYNSSKMKLCKIWYIIYQSKDNSVLIIFY